MNANQIASSRPASSRKLAKVRPSPPGAANNSPAGMSVRLRHRRLLFAPTRSTTSVTSARPTWVSSAAPSASSRVNVRSAYASLSASHTTAVSDSTRLLSEPYV